MNDHVKMRFWQSCFFLVVLLSALMAAGCNSYHTAAGFWRDIGVLGVNEYNKAIAAQDKIDHGDHFEHYKANVGRWFK